jgi:hypothetical protein
VAIRSQSRRPIIPDLSRAESDPSWLVDAFVRKINSQPREPEPVDEVPAFLRAAAVADSLPETLVGWTGWRIVQCDNSARIDALQNRTGTPFPPSFQHFLAKYSFPALEFGSLMFFANTGEETFWELGKRLFQDKHMSTQRLEQVFSKSGIRPSTTTILSASIARARESKSESFSWITKRFFSAVKCTSSKRLRLRLSTSCTPPFVEPV